MTPQESILLRIEASLDTMRQYLKDDGGNIEIVELTDDMILKLRLMGSCSTCPQSYMTMRAGIENAVRLAVPEVKGVEAVNLSPIAND